MNTKALKQYAVLIFLMVSTMLAKAGDTIQTNAPNDPYLVQTKNFTVKNFSLKQIDMGITAVIYNPYKVKVKIEEILIDVFIEGKKLGTITQSIGEVKIFKQSAFDLPLVINVQTGPTLSKFFTEGAKLAVGKPIKVDYVGYVKIKALGFIPVKVKINDSAYFTRKDVIGY